MPITMDEIWKDIEGYEGWYQVSNYGRVRSWKNNACNRRKEPKILKLTLDRHGYFKALLCDRGIQKNHSVHRLVMESFVPNPNNKSCVNHKDGDKGNNHISNLEWVTRSENDIHAFNNDLRKPLRGSEVGGSRLTETDVLDIRNAYNLGCFTQKEIGESYNVHPETIGHIVRRNTWKHV